MFTIKSGANFDRVVYTRSRNREKWLLNAENKVVNFYRRMAVVTPDAVLLLNSLPLPENIL